MKDDGFKNEKEMEELENMIFKKTVEVNDQLKMSIKSMCDIYKEFRKNGLSGTEAIALMSMMFGLGGKR